MYGPRSVKILAILFLCDMVSSLCVHPIVVYLCSDVENGTFFLACMFDNRESVFPVIQLDLILFFNIHLIALLFRY